MPYNSSGSRGNLSGDLQNYPKFKDALQQNVLHLVNLPESEDFPKEEVNINLTGPEFPDPFRFTAVETTPATSQAGPVGGDPENAGSDVSGQEKEDLEAMATDMPTKDDLALRNASLDNMDEEGDPLNEGGFRNNVAGTDLDVPGAEDDDEDESIGEEDEENNEYSLGGDNHDDIPQDNF